MWEHGHGDEDPTEFYERQGKKLDSLVTRFERQGTPFHVLAGESANMTEAEVSETTKRLEDLRTIAGEAYGVLLGQGVDDREATIELIKVFHDRFNLGTARATAIAIAGKHGIQIALAEAHKTADRSRIMQTPGLLSAMEKEVKTAVEQKRLIDAKRIALGHIAKIGAIQATRDNNIAQRTATICKEWKQSHGQKGGAPRILIHLGPAHLPAAYLQKHLHPNITVRVHLLTESLRTRKPGLYRLLDRTSQRMAAGEPLREKDVDAGLLHLALEGQDERFKTEPGLKQAKQMTGRLKPGDFERIAKQFEQPRAELWGIIRKVTKTKKTNS